MSQNLSKPLFDDSVIISAYQPEAVRNIRQEHEQPTDLAHILRQFTGTERYHVDSGLFLTDGVKYLLDVTQGYVLLDFIWSHAAAIAAEEDSFTVMNLLKDGEVRIHDGRARRRYLAAKNLGLRLPCNVRLYTGALGNYLVLMLASEY